MENTSFDFDLILLQKSLKEKSSRSNIENLCGINWDTNNEKIDDVINGIVDLLGEINPDSDQGLYDSDSSISFLGTCSKNRF